MAKLADDMKELIESQKMSFVATAGSDGIPNVSPKGTIRVLDDETLIFADLFSTRTRTNVRGNPKIALSVVDEKARRGYQFKGQAELLSQGPLYEKMVKDLESLQTTIKNVVKIRVEEIYDLTPSLQ